MKNSNSTYSLNFSENFVNTIDSILQNEYSKESYCEHLK